jgi:hypothetical protein
MCFAFVVYLWGLLSKRFDDVVVVLFDCATPISAANGGRNNERVELA